MAISALVSNSPLEPRIISPGKIPMIIHGMGEASGQVYNAGAILKNSAGTSNQCEAALTSANDMGAITLLGIALKDATGTTNTAAPCLVPDFDSEVYIKASTNGTAVDITSTLFPIGDGFDIYVDGSGHQTLNSATESNAKLQVIGYIYDATGALTQWLRCRPVPATWCALSGAIS